MDLDRLPQDFDPESIARIYEHLLDEMDPGQRAHVEQVASEHPGLWLRDLGPDRLELYFSTPDGEVSVGQFPRRWLLQPAIHTES
jgi:hypothetical protein